MSITYAGSTIGIVNALPTTYDQAGYELLTFDNGICAIESIPAISRTWTTVAANLACRTTNFESKGSAMFEQMTYVLHHIPGDTAQAVYEALEADPVGVGSFKLTLAGGGGVFYLTAAVSQFKYIDGGAQDEFQKRSVILLPKSEPVYVAAA